MARAKYHRDSRGIAEILKSGEMHAMTAAAGQQIASHAQPIAGPAHPVTVRTVTTDRAHTIVAIESPAGLGIEGKRGPLTKGAAAVGLTIRQSRD